MSNHSKCGECKHAVQYSSIVFEEILKCTCKDSGYYKVCKKTMACDKFEKKICEGDKRNA